MNRRVLHVLLLALCFLIGCGGRNGDAPPLSLGGWQITEGWGTALQLTPDGLFSFVFPGMGGVIGYVEKPYVGSPPTQITIQFSVTGNGIFQITDPTDSLPATLHLLVAANDNNRYWYDTEHVDLADGTFTIVAPLDPAQWSGAAGGHPASLNNVVAVGFTMGGFNHSWGHGVLVSHGTAIFTLLSYSVQ